MSKTFSFFLFFLVLLTSCTPSPSFDIKIIEPTGVSDTLPGDAPGVPTLNPVIDITANSAVITWAPNLTNGRVVGSYELEYGIKSSLVGPTILPNLNPPYTLSELQPNTQYFVRIKAINSTSASSSVIRYFTTLALPPNAPLLLPVTATQKNAVINWNGGENATIFTISYGLTADLVGATVLSGIQKPFGLNNLTQNTQYFFKINASNTTGSIDSTVETFSTLIDSPGAPVLGLPSTTQASAKLLWTAGQGGLTASYNLKYSTSLLMTNAVSVSNINSPYILNGLTQGTVYYYQITAVNKTGISDSPIGFFSTAFDPPAAPILSSTQVTANSATLVWSVGAGGAPLSYNVSYGATPSLAGATSLTNVSSPLDLTNLTPGTAYYYKVTAVNQAAAVDSVISSFTTSLLLPAAPILGAATPAQTSSLISWSPGTGGGPSSSYSLSYGPSPTLAGATVITNVSSIYNLINLSANTVYYYKITAINSAGGSSSPISNFTTSMMAPGAPTLGAVSFITSNSASISWTSASTGGAATSYDLKWGTSSTLVGAATISNVTDPKVLSSLNANTTYYYQIVAINSAGSTSSLISSFTTSMLLPSAPVLAAVSVMPNSATLSWSAGAGGGSVSSYSVKYGTSATLTGATVSSSVTAPFVVSNLLPSTTYYYQVTATNSAGSTSSAIASFITTALTAAAPVISGVSAITANSGTITWGPNATSGAPLSYTLRYSTAANFAGATSVTSASSPAILAALLPATTYYVEVSANYASGSAVSTTAFSTLATAPAAPVLGAVTPSQTSALISWSAGTVGGAATSYSLSYGTSPTLTGATVVANVASVYNLINLTANTLYYFKMTAVNSAGSTSSALTSFTTLILAPGAPNLSAITSLTTTSASLSWTPAATGGAVTTYDLKWGTSQSLIGATTVSNVTSPSALTGLTANTTFYYQIVANNSSGSTSSSIGSFITSMLLPPAPVLGAVTPTQTSSMISWSAGVGGGVVSSYSLSYGTNAALTGASVITNVTSSYNLTSLSTNTLYYYKVTAINTTGSTSSTIASFTTSMTAPGAPSLGVVTLDMTTASVVWSAGITGGTPSSYNFILSTNSALTGATPVIGASSPRLLTGLTANTTYYYQVIAVNNGGQASSSIGSFTTKPLLPSAPVIGAITPLQTSATISWSTGGAGGAVSSYQLTYGTSSTLTGAQTISNVTSAYSLSGLAPFTLYYVMITATNASGSTNSTISSFTTLMQAPGAPVLGSVTSITTTSASLKWTASASGGSASTFDLKWGTSSTLASAATLANVTTPKVLSGLAANSTYYYQVVATNSAGSTSSAIGNFTTIMSGPDAPVLGSITNIAQTSATVNWSSGPNISLNSFTTTLHPVMINRCSSCHSTAAYGTTGHGSTVASTSHDAMFFIDSVNRKKIDFATPTISRLYTKLLEPHACGPSCSGEVLTAINSWIAAGGGTGGIATAYRLEYSTSQAMTNVTQISSATSPQVLQGLTAGTTYYYRVVAINSTSSTNSIQGSFQTSAATIGGPVVVDYGLEILMGDRRYVESVLRDVFGISSDSVAPGTTIRDNIFRKAEFGGACDVYAPVYLDDTNVEIISETCFSGLTDNNKANSNASRQALVTKTCHTLVANSTAINNVFVKIFGSTTAGVVDDAKLALAYQLFYPDDVLSTDVKTALVTLANTQTSNTEKWRMIVLGLCVSPEWQSP